MTSARRVALRLFAVIGLATTLWWALDIGVYLVLGPMWETVAEHSDTPPQFLEAVYELRRERAEARARGDSPAVAALEASLDRAAERARRKASQALEDGDRLGALVWEAAGAIAADRQEEGTPAPRR